MNRRIVIALFAGFALLSLAACQPSRSVSVGGHSGTPESVTDALHFFLQHRVEVEKKDVGIVVGLVDERGSQVVSCGKMDTGTGRPVDGDTLFEIGSITKPFTGLLLQDMVERGEMKLDDPIAKYLPTSIKVPTYHGKQITLLDLATHTSGLPDNADNLEPRRADNSRADYTLQQLDTFVSGYTLTREPGSKFEYSTVGIALLAQAITQKAGREYEALVVDRICRPLKMDSTRITLTPELSSRFAQGHNYYGYKTAHTDWGALAGGAALRSTANDLLKFISANLALAPSDLTRLLKETHIARFRAHLDADTDVDTNIGLTWMIMHDTDRTTIIGHGGLTRGFTTFMGFDLARHRGVVVVCNSLDLDVSRIGRILLESEWRPELRPSRSSTSDQMDQLLGEYRISPAQANGTLTRHGIGIYREGDRLFMEITGPATWPRHVLTPPVEDELVPESENVFFQRLSGVRIVFSRDFRGNITGFSGRYRDRAFSYVKISDQPPKVPGPPKPSVTIRLDSKHLDVLAGNYEFAPNAAYPKGLKLTIWREGDQLIGQFSGENALQGAFDVYPTSETDFFITIDGSHLTFRKNDKGVVTAITYHQDREADLRGHRI